MHALAQQAFDHVTHEYARYESALQAADLGLVWLDEGIVKSAETAAEYAETIEHATAYGDTMMDAALVTLAGGLTFHHVNALWNGLHDPDKTAGAAWRTYVDYLNSQSNEALAAGYARAVRDEYVTADGHRGRNAHMVLL